MHDPWQSFRAAILAALGPSVRLPEAIEPGRLLRFPTSDRRGDGAGWCRLFADLRRSRRYVAELVARRSTRRPGASPGIPKTALHPLAAGGRARFLD